MAQGREFTSAITVRLGMVSACVLGGLAGHWVGAMSVPAGEKMLIWPTVTGAASGFATSWAALTWLARRHRQAGVIVGGVLMIAAAVVLLARLVY